MNKNTPQFYRRNLPHYQPPGATFFITLRLAGSLPKQTIINLQHQKEVEIQEIKQQFPNEKHRHQRLYQSHKRHFGRFDELLDISKTGPKWLKRPDIATIVADSIRHRDHKEYNLICYCIMPNYVHFVISDLKLLKTGTAYGLTKMMQNLKRYTATRANKRLNRVGKQFWQNESYDHVVWGNQELRNIINYVLNNPVKANLDAYMFKYPWVYSIYHST